MLYYHKMRVNLTHEAFKHASVHRMELNLTTIKIYPFLKFWPNLKAASLLMWDLGTKASNQNVASYGVFTRVGWVSGTSERCRQPTRPLRENELDGVFCPNKVALPPRLMCTRPRVRGTSLCCLLFTSAHYSTAAAPSRTPARSQPQARVEQTEG